MRTIQTTRRDFLGMSAALAAALTGCAQTQGEQAGSAAATTTAATTSTARETITCSEGSAHAITVSGESKAYRAVDVVKTGDADGDEADFYGTNAAVYAEQGGELSLDDITVDCNGAHANAVFSYGEGTKVTIANSTIHTTSNCSGGIMVTGGGTLEAHDLTIHTTGNSSAAIRSDRGGGTQVVDGGSYTTDGTGSPVIYSTADVSVSNAQLTSTASQGVVVEGKNSVTLKDCELTASNTTKNSDKSDWYQAVMIYQSMSGDAAEGEASFGMSGGTLHNANGDVFFVNNTVATIELSKATITNADASGVLLRAAAAGWGNEGSNGGQVTLRATQQQLEGQMLADEVSHINLYLADGSDYAGAINASGAAGEVYVELTGSSTWTLTADSHITALSCDATGVNLNGYALYVGETAYVAGTASTGSAIEAQVSAGGGPGGQGGPGGEPPAAPPDGGQGGPGGGDGTPPEKPSA